VTLGGLSLLAALPIVGVSVWRVQQQARLRRQPRIHQVPE